MTNTQETWGEEITYILSQSSPAGCQYSDSRYSNQMTVDVVKDLISKVEQQAITRTRLEVREEILEQLRKPREFPPENQPEIYANKRTVAHDLGYSRGFRDVLNLPSLQITDEKK